MASCFRRTYRKSIPDGAEIIDRRGVQMARWRDAHNRIHTAPLSEDKKSILIPARTWTIEYTSADGKRVTVKGFVDKDATEKKGRDLERQAAQIRAGLIAHDPDRSTSPIRQAIDAWVADLQRQDRAPRYVTGVQNIMLRVIENCGWATLAGIRSDTLIAWLATPAMRELSGRTRNEYLQTAQTFCAWCEKQRPLPWLTQNPLKYVARADESEKRNLRYALTPDQLVRLRDVSGDRWTVYLAACLTGLRRSELRALRWGDVHLDVERPYVQLPARKQKARRPDVVALPPQLVEALVVLHAARVNSDPVFPRMPVTATVRRDFGRAAIPWRDDQNRMGGLHCLRKTFVTMLSQSETPVRTAMEAARVTSVKLLHDVYTDAKLLDLSAAAKRMPRVGEKIIKPDNLRQPK
jgi:integrase